MTVTVTSNHIVRGSRNNILHNPIALAIQELDRNEYAVVTPTRIHRPCIHGRPEGRPCTIPFCGIVMLPEYARQWLEAFNENRCIAPFQFTL